MTLDAVVCDQSAALIRAICLAFNHCSLTDYIDWSYQRVHGDSSKEKVLIKVCIAHILRNIKSHLPSNRLARRPLIAAFQDVAKAANYNDFLAGEIFSTDRGVC
jgi:hypothetical protein